MDNKSKQIYDKIENFLEERKGRERRNPEDEPIATSEPEPKKSSERRKKQDRRNRD